MFLGPAIRRLIPADTRLNDRGRPLHYKCSLSGVVLATGDLNHGRIKRTAGGGLFRCDGFTWSQGKVCLSQEESCAAGTKTKIRGRSDSAPVHTQTQSKGEFFQ